MISGMNFFQFFLVFFLFLCFIFSLYYYNPQVLTSKSWQPYPEETDSDVRELFVLHAAYHWLRSLISF